MQPTPAITSHTQPSRRKPIQLPALGLPALESHEHDPNLYWRARVPPVRQRMPPDDQLRKWSQTKFVPEHHATGPIELRLKMLQDVKNDAAVRAAARVQITMWTDLRRTIHDHLFQQLVTRVKQLADSGWFSGIIFAVILANTACMILNTVPVMQVPYEYYLQQADAVFYGIYIIEALIKFIAYGLGYFSDKWNWLDFAILLANTADFGVNLFEADAKNLTQVLKILRLLRVFRALRALRMLRALKFLKSLNAIVLTCIKSLESVGLIFLFMLMILFMFAVMGRELYGSTGPKGMQHFGNLINSVGTLFQITTLDDWFLVVLDMVYKDNCWHFVLFAIVYVTVECLVLLNLFIAVLVDNFQTTRASFADDKPEQTFLPPKTDDAGEDGGPVLSLEEEMKQLGRRHESSAFPVSRRLSSMHRYRGSSVNAASRHSKRHSHGHHHHRHHHHGDENDENRHKRSASAGDVPDEPVAMSVTDLTSKPRESSDGANNQHSQASVDKGQRSSADTEQDAELIYKTCFWPRGEVFELGSPFIDFGHLPQHWQEHYAHFFRLLASLDYYGYMEDMHHVALEKLYDKAILRVPDENEKVGAAKTKTPLDDAGYAAMHAKRDEEMDYKPKYAWFLRRTLNK